jgi:hypothetical protein
MTGRAFTSLLLIGAIALAGTAARATSSGSPSTTNLQAALTASEQIPAASVLAPSAQALFAATLSGRTLSWRLTFRGLSSAPLSAHLHLGARRHTGALALRLCAPCKSGAKGTAMLKEATAASLLRGAVYVDLHTRRNPRGEIRGQIAASPVPTLVILSPNDGETITPPTPVRFTVSGFTLGQGGGHIEAFVAGMADTLSVELQLSGTSGLAYLPANKLLTGMRDVTFVLARADGTLLENPEARVTVSRLTILGGR